MSITIGCVEPRPGSTAQPGLTLIFEPRPGSTAQPGLTRNRALSKGLSCFAMLGPGVRQRCCQANNNGRVQPVHQKVPTTLSWVGWLAWCPAYTCEDPRRLPPHALGVRDTSSEAVPAVSQWGPPRLRVGDVGDPVQHSPPVPHQSRSMPFAGVTVTEGPKDVYVRCCGPLRAREKDLKSPPGGYFWVCHPQTPY